MSLKNYKVVDAYNRHNQGPVYYMGTQTECQEFVNNQTLNTLYQIVPMTEEEINQHPDNLTILQGFESCMEFYRRNQRNSQ